MRSKVTLQAAMLAAVAVAVHVAVRPSVTPGHWDAHMVLNVASAVLSIGFVGVLLMTGGGYSLILGAVGAYLTYPQAIDGPGRSLDLFGLSIIACILGALGMARESEEADE